MILPVELQSRLSENHQLNVPLIKNLCPFKTDNGLIKVVTKVSNRENIQGYRYPVILPSKHPVVSKINYEEHLNHFHRGV